METVTRVENEAEVDLEERRVYEAWHIAGLANDPERRDEATTYCRETLERDPGNYRMVAWALARRLEVNLTQAGLILRERCDASEASVQEVIALLVYYAQSGEVEQALEVLRTSKSLFLKEGAEELQSFWEIQLAALRGKLQAPPVSRAAGGLAAEVALVSLRARAQAANDSEPLIAELRIRAENGDDTASFELCHLATVRGQESPQLSQNDIEGSGQMLLSAAMCLYCRSDSSGGGGRFAKIGELLDSLTDRWPALIEQGHRFVETLIDGLPNSESRWLWRLQVKLRAAR